MSAGGGKRPAELIPFLFALLPSDEIRSLIDAVHWMSSARKYDEFLLRIRKAAGTSDLSAIDLSGWREKAGEYGRAMA